MTDQGLCCVLRLIKIYKQVSFIEVFIKLHIICSTIDHGVAVGTKLE